jgi:hypothetical protein
MFHTFSSIFHMGKKIQLPMKNPRFPSLAHPLAAAAPTPRARAAASTSSGVGALAVWESERRDGNYGNDDLL